MPFVIRELPSELEQAGSQHAQSVAQSTTEALTQTFHGMHLETQYTRYR